MVIRTGQASPAVQLTRHAHAQLAAALAELDTMPPGTRLYGPDLARLAGVAPLTITHYNAEANGRRRAGQPKPRDLPAPAGHSKLTAELAVRLGVRRPARRPGGGKPQPYWYPATIRPWLEGRHHAGRPRNDQRSPAPPGAYRGRRPRRPGPKPRRAPGA